MWVEKGTTSWPMCVVNIYSFSLSFFQQIFIETYSLRAIVPGTGDVMVNRTYTSEAGDR